MFAALTPEAEWPEMICGVPLLVFTKSQNILDILGLSIYLFIYYSFNMIVRCYRLNARPCFSSFLGGWGWGVGWGWGSGMGWGGGGGGGWGVGGGVGVGVGGVGTKE